jgi:hypothetical protein
MKRLISKILCAYLSWRIKRFHKALMWLATHGTVRQIRDTAKVVRAFGEHHDSPEWVEVARIMDENAEKIVLRRVFK